MYKCEQCNIEFKTFQEKANHCRWKHFKYTFKNSKTKSLFKSNLIEREEKLYGGKLITKEYKCIICQKVFIVTHRDNKPINKKFCSVSCANKIRKQTKETKLKISKSIKLAWKKGKFDNIDFYEKQSKNKRFTSKVERSIVEYFKTHYPEHQWTSGGRLLFKNISLTRDLYSNILKICFEYDGIWHFKDINGQLKSKQLKDKYLEEWCIENNYRLVRVDDIEYKDFKQIEKLFFERNESIIKIGTRY